MALWVACAPGVDAGSTSSAIEAEWTLVFDQRVFAAPVGGDAPPRYTLAWERGGERVASELPPVLEAFAFDFDSPSSGASAPTNGRSRGRPDVVALLPDGRLVRFVSGEPEAGVELARAVVGRPGVAPHAFAYVVAAGGQESAAEVHWFEAGEDRVLDRSLLTFGGLRIAPDGRHVLGFGAVNGGVAGLHVVGPDGARCLTNCALRTGPGWLAQAGADFVPLPRAPGGLFFEGDEVRWDAGGTTYRATWRLR